MRIGAHVSSAGGHHLVFERARKIGAEAVQLFISAPQQWKANELTDEQIAAFRGAREQYQMPAFFHGVYLVNFGSADDALLARSKESLKHYLRSARLLGAEGTIFHVGSHLGAGFDEGMVKRICGMLREVLDDDPGNETKLILENNAGQGNCIGGTFKELGQLVRGLDNDPRVTVCIDTCHAFAMGYDLATEEGCDKAMDEFDREVGFERLVAVHANDSKMPIGTFRDRHANIGEGTIGSDGFRCLMSHRAFADVPFLLEVPGFKGDGPDLKNVRRLKQLRAEAGAPQPPKPPRIARPKKAK